MVVVVTVRAVRSSETIRETAAFLRFNTVL